MYLNLRVLLLAFFATQHNCLGFYIRRNTVNSPAKELNSHNDEWGVFQNTLGLSNEKVELLKSQKDQQGTKELLNRFILENPKYSLPTNTKKSKRFGNQLKRLLRALVGFNLKSSKRTLKTTFNFELRNNALKPLKRVRRKISLNMVSDMSSERIEHLLQMFYQKHNIDQSHYNNDRAEQLNGDGDADGDYNNSDSDSDSDLTPHSSMESDADSDYAYDNLYDDEGDVSLTAKSRQNSEYGSFQDLILQANRKQWERESEETKLHSPLNDHFI
ncbi:GH19570 [Drosophila grimshawi]|uniref:GH19570 n=1 Tax=Drosophila grimshawi TaxID=7222 RepID=B4JHN4_DROGR|nr:GH19570 [Drosophila grimshawi]